MPTDTDDSRTAHDHSLHFADSLKDLRNLREQLYTAAERFESSYDKNDHKQLVVQLSKDYVAKALVSTVDHLGSVADKLNKFLGVKADEFSATNKTFSSIQQRLTTFEELIELRRMSEQLLMVQATAHAKRYILPASETSPFDKSEEVFRHCISDPPHNEQQGISISEEFKGARKKTSGPPPLLSKQQSRMMMTTSQSPTPHSFSFAGVLPNKESERNKKGRRSISPFRFSLNRSGPDSKRSASPSSSCFSEPRRAMSARRRRQDEDTMNTDNEIETHTSRSKQLFRAMISVHRSGKEIVHKNR